MQTHCTRELILDASQADSKMRRVPAVISSETPVPRKGYIEVLSHRVGSVNTTRAPLPLLESHDGSRLNIGLVENLRLDTGRLRGDIVLGTSQRANELWPDIQAGVVRNLSIGYTIDRYHEDGDRLIADRWTPHEVSLVAVPADPAAGTYRSFPMNEQTENEPAGVATIGERMSRGERRALHAERNSVNDAVDAERARCREIRAMLQARARDIGPKRSEALADEMIADGTSITDARAAVLAEFDRRPRQQALTALHTSGDASPWCDGKREFSLVRALRSMLDPSSVDAGYEREVSQELARQMGRTPRGIYMPMGNLQQRAVTAAGAPALIGTDQLAGNFIDALHARSVVMNLGPMILAGLVGNVSVPRLSTSATAQWIAGDGTDGLTESTPGFDAVTLSPKTLGGLVNISRQSLLQSTPNAEMTVRGDLAQILAVEIDRVALAGSGASNQPRGIVNTAGISTGTFSGAAPTFAEIVAMEGALLSANVDAAGAAYVTTPALAVDLKTTPKAANQALFIWEAGSDPGAGVMNGKRAFATSNVSAGKVILGNFADLIVGLWGGVDIEVNPYADFAKGIVSVRAFASLDIAVRHAKSFAVYSTP